MQPTSPQPCGCHGNAPGKLRVTCRSNLFPLSVFLFLPLPRAFFLPPIAPTGGCTSSPPPTARVRDLIASVSVVQRNQNAVSLRYRESVCIFYFAENLICFFLCRVQFQFSGGQKSVNKSVLLKTLYVVLVLVYLPTNTLVICDMILVI